MNQTFMALLDEKIELFKHSFNVSARHSFVDPLTGKLFHAGEFGSRREKLLRDFLRLAIPARLAIGEGFLINATGKTSTQVDFVVYDVSAIPRLESVEQQRFFPVEGVVSIGEVKSRLSKKSLRDALNKLARVKMTADDVSSTNYLHRDLCIKDKPFSRELNQYDQIFSFIVCESFDFDPSSLVNEIGGWYDSDIMPHHKHNMVLSIKDGLLLYEREDKPWMYPPTVAMPVKNRFAAIEPGDNTHFHIFSLYMNSATTSGTILIPELIYYMPPLKNVVNSDETNFA